LIFLNKVSQDLYTINGPLFIENNQATYVKLPSDVFRLRIQQRRRQKIRLKKKKEKKINNILNKVSSILHTKNNHFFIENKSATKQKTLIRYRCNQDSL
jgi:hypothetical protein